MDERGVQVAYTTYAAAVYGRCRRLLRDEQAARDVTQEVFERCFRKRDGLRPGRELLAWLYRVATNLCLNALRDSRTRRGYEEAHGALGEPTTACGADLRVMDVLRGLDPRTQAIAIYIYVDGMTQAEAAEVAQVTDRTVRNCLARFVAHGRRRLGIDLQEDFG